MSLLTVMKSLPLAYNKDMQEDKEPVFDALDTLHQCIPVFTAMVGTMTVLPQNMRAAASKGFLNATDCADYLTKKGMPFRDAYKISGKLVYLCTEKNCTLEDLSLTELKKLSPPLRPRRIRGHPSRYLRLHSARATAAPPSSRRAMQIAAIEHVYCGTYKMNENARRQYVGGLILRIRRFRAPAIFQAADWSCS